MIRVNLITGHVLEALKSLPDESVHCVVTSPPYWGLRDYGIEPVVWPDGWRGCLGLEPTIELFVEHIVEIFREVRRVLRKDGVCFVNLGDSYAGGNISGKRSDKSFTTDAPASWGSRNPKNLGEKLQSTIVSGLKPKDLCGVPWRVALALQADGWWLRSDIIWAKPNPMPESVTDRPTRSHEYIFMLTKSARYHWDAEAVREGEQVYTRKAGGYKGFEATHAGNCQKGGLADKDTTTVGRNLRSVWTIATAPFPEAHFATFPSALVEKCIKAGTSEHGVCSICGAPWVRVVKRGKLIGRRKNPGKPSHLSPQGYLRDGKSRCGLNEFTLTQGWHPSCSCDKPDADVGLGVGDERVPATVLDPFSGAGTTCLVAAKMGRNAIGIEMKPEYQEMAAKRIKADMGMLVEVLATAAAPEWGE